MVNACFLHHYLLARTMLTSGLAVVHHHCLAAAIYKMADGAIAPGQNYQLHGWPPED